MERLLELAARCEAATLPLPDRTLNRAIARAVGWGYQTPSEARRKNPKWFHPDDCRDGAPVLDSLHGTDVWREPLDYVGSLDAAMTLVPDGMIWMLTNSGLQHPTKPDFNKASAVVDDWTATTPMRERSAASPALALTAAALRARAALSGKADDGGKG